MKTSENTTGRVPRLQRAAGLLAALLALAVPLTVLGSVAPADAAPAKVAAYCGTTKSWSFGANSSHGMPTRGPSGSASGRRTA